MRIFVGYYRDGLKRKVVQDVHFSIKISMEQNGMLFAYSREDVAQMQSGTNPSSNPCVLASCTI